MKLKYVVKKIKTLKQVLKEDLSISERLYKKVKNDRILVNGNPAKTYINVNPNDIVEINLDFDETCENIVSNKDIKIEVLYEDEWLLIINKQPFIPVHPSCDYYETSLSNGVKYYYDIHNIHKKIRIVNRLDKNTTGIVIFAKSEYIQDNLINYEKEYIAIIEGTLHGRGIIDKPIARKENSIIERCISETGQNAITYYEVVKNISTNNQDLTVVKCKLKTRTYTSNPSSLCIYQSSITRRLIIWK